MNAFAHLNVFYNSVFMMSSPATADNGVYNEHRKGKDVFRVITKDVFAFLVL